MLRQNDALKEQWPELPDSRPRCVGRGGPAPPPAAPFLLRLHTLPPSTALLPKWRPTASFPARHWSPDHPSPAPSCGPALRRRPNSLRECAAGRHAPEARAVRGGPRPRTPALRMRGAPGAGPAARARPAGQLAARGRRGPLGGPQGARPGARAPGGG